MTSGENSGAAAARLERRLFEILGGWVPSTVEPEVKLMLRGHSFQHAWHAELWQAVATGRSAVDVAPVARAVEAMAALEGTAERLSAAYGNALPALVGVYSAARAGTSPEAEGPTVRALTLMLADDEAAIRQAREFLLRADAKARTIT